MEFQDGLYNLYREVNEVSLLNKLFVTLISEKLNITNYTTNANIQNKMYLKDSLEEISYIIDDSLEKIANLIKIKKGYPIYKIDDIELISLIKTKISIEYNETTIIESLKGEIAIILKLINDILEKTGDNKSYEIITILSTISYQLQNANLNIS